jgi:hypothetical protein
MLHHINIIRKKERFNKALLHILMTGKITSDCLPVTSEDLCVRILKTLSSDTEIQEGSEKSKIIILYQSGPSYP